MQISIAGTGRQEKLGADCAGHPVRKPDLRITELGEFPRFRQVAGIGNICIPAGRNSLWYYASESELMFWLSTSMTTCGHDRVPAGGIHARLRLPCEIPGEKSINNREDDVWIWMNI